MKTSVSGNGNGLKPLILGIFEGHSDPAVAAVRGGKIIAYCEEERLLRFKHAHGLYPIRAMKYCLKEAGATLADVKAVGINWDLDAFSNGRMAKHFKTMRSEFDVDPGTVAWQGGMLRRFTREGLGRHHEARWRRAFGDMEFPPLHPVPHHYTHAFQGCMQSPFDRSVCLTIDGSGDEHCCVVWRHEGETITPLREIKMPHSLGWFYAAFTEYMGFDAYDGEYKVMGLAAYGRPNAELRSKVDQVLQAASDGIEYRVDPSYIHYGPHSWSTRYSDNLVELLGAPPRLPDGDITAWHEDLAYAVQVALEDAVERLALWAVKETGIKNVTISGGVGLNIKMNSRLFKNSEIDDVHACPLCSDGGAALGAALAASYQLTGERPEVLRSLALGPQTDDAEIERVLKLAGVKYEKPDDICEATARELAAGRVAGWFQGRMEAGPRALGHRSILADPRRVENRDKVNAIIKFREYWRPFCPSMPVEAAPRYFRRHTRAPFMIISFEAAEELRQQAPAIVHVDGTSRVQLVDGGDQPLYHGLLRAFDRTAGVPVLLNTSFNIKGEPIVCSIQDALRTFWATGLEVLAAGSYLIRKPTLEGTA